MRSSELFCMQELDEAEIEEARRRRQKNDESEMCAHTLLCELQALTSYTVHTMLLDASKPRIQVLSVMTTRA